MADDIFKDLKKNSKYNALAPLAFSLTQTKEIKELENVIF